VLLLIFELVVFVFVIKEMEGVDTFTEQATYFLHQLSCRFYPIAAPRLLFLFSAFQTLAAKPTFGIASPSATSPYHKHFLKELKHLLPID